MTSALETELDVPIERAMVVSSVVNEPGDSHVVDDDGDTGAGTTTAVIVGAGLAGVGVVIGVGRTAGMSDPWTGGERGTEGPADVAFCAASPNVSLILWAVEWERHSDVSRDKASRIGCCCRRFRGGSHFTWD